MQNDAFTTSFQAQSRHAQVLAEHATSIRRLHKRSLADLIEIGRLLSECKKLVGHGKWLPWLKREFAWSERTARHYIAVYRAFGSKAANFADLDLRPSSLYRLSAPSTPVEVRNKIMDRIGAGEALNGAAVKNVIQNAKDHNTTFRRPSVRATIQEAMVRSGWSVLGKLTPIEKRRSLEIAKREGLEISLEWAETRASFKKSHRNILLALDFAETAAKRSIRKIAAEIPHERHSEMARRLSETSEFFAKLCSELRRTDTAEDVVQARGKPPNQIRRQMHAHKARRYRRPQ